ncbi:endonuclease/exonuclease/phosphatase family metal-dependent hydrolase [Haloactinopolyspora alba]|uniref:Endonuclease/exonuclease/phosphatase family metal-dependent hydrolase n=1 Tax=Haloactinopolyspora alba TaxID=648780 RepID=A0A2P8DLZ7_9ACTN|nr:endonuclease/exonuclease/phosphatase family protein [Haloactinopolyspora alba]PSK98221.1 endonuclease/exonuclease/phosphatase family metal-dependent hydrolase [Haloactinopolyspora alba]
MRIRRSALAAIVALVTAMVATVTSTPAATADPSARDRPLSVMSFNIHHGVGTDGRLDLQRIADVVKSEGADVVGLQEVDRHWSERSDFVDQAAWLARELNMHVVYGANLDRDPREPGAPRRQYGTAILSERPIRDWDNTFLPQYEGSEQRGLLRAHINVRGIWIQVYNTHLQHDDAAERLDQVAAVEELIGEPDESVILLGDLNATPRSPEIGELMDGLVDSWEEAGVGDGSTYPGDDPRTRIDYVLTSGDVVTRTAAVVATDASDHRPVSADVLLPGSSVGGGPNAG